MRAPEGQRGIVGVALLIAVLVAALATIQLTEIAWETNLDIRRSANLRFQSQARLYALGAEAWAADTLVRDRQEEAEPRDHFGEDWATSLPPIQVEGGSIVGQLEDLQGRFNVNNLLTATGETSQAGVDQFRRLANVLGLDETLVFKLADWLDRNVEPAFPDGAEDDVYTASELPYRTANMPITTTSELLAIDGFDLRTYNTLKPHIAALPVGTTINANTATGAVLQSLGENLSASGVTAVLDERAEFGLESAARLNELLGGNITVPVALSSEFFRATIQVSIGTTQLTLYSVLARDATGVTQAMVRSFGSE